MPFLTTMKKPMFPQEALKADLVNNYTAFPDLSLAKEDKNELYHEPLREVSTNIIHNTPRKRGHVDEQKELKRELSGYDIKLL